MAERCSNCGQNLERYPAPYPNLECPTLEEVEQDKRGLPTRWSRYRELLSREAHVATAKKRRRRHGD